MFARLKRKKLMMRVNDYLLVHPEDEPAAKAIYLASQGLGARSAREAASITARRELSDEEWREFGPRWERAWAFIIR